MAISTFETLPRRSSCLWFAIAWSWEAVGLDGLWKVRHCWSSG